MINYITTICTRLLTERFEDSVVDSVSPCVTSSLLNGRSCQYKVVVAVQELLSETIQYREILHPSEIRTNSVYILPVLYLEFIVNYKFSMRVSIVETKQNHTYEKIDNKNP